MHSLKTSTLAAAVGLAALGLTFAPSSAHAQTPTYLAVGDSVAYGYQNDTVTPPGIAGYPGYTQAYASFLSQQAGTPVTLLNLGIVGETTSSLLSTTTNNGALNANYTGTTSQFDLLTSELKNSQLNVTHITVQLGANDILGLATSTAFETAVETNNQAAQQQLLGATLTSIEGSDNTLLNQINMLDPNAKVQVLGYYDPYAALPPTNPINIYLRTVSPTLNSGLNAAIAQEAATYHDQFVDLATPFAGHEDTLTLSNQLLDFNGIMVPNDHPTDAGYAVIAQQLEGAPVPEASTLVSTGLLLMLGISGLIAARRKRRA